MTKIILLSPVWCYKMPPVQILFGLVRSELPVKNGQPNIYRST